MSHIHCWHTFTEVDPPDGWETIHEDICCHCQARRTALWRLTGAKATHGPHVPEPRVVACGHQEQITVVEAG